MLALALEEEIHEGRLADPSLPRHEITRLRSRARAARSVSSSDSRPTTRLAAPCCAGDAGDPGQSRIVRVNMLNLGNEAIAASEQPSRRRRRRARSVGRARGSGASSRSLRSCPTASTTSAWVTRRLGFWTRNRRMANGLRRSRTSWSCFQRRSGIRDPNEKGANESTWASRSLSEPQASDVAVASQRLRPSTGRPPPCRRLTLF